MLDRNKPLTLSDITTNDVVYYELINKYIIDDTLAKYSIDEKAFQENQEVFTLRIPKPRHFRLNFLLTRILHLPSKAWMPFENLYTNHKFKLTQGILNIFVKKNVTKDTNIFYYTTANQILALQDLGLTKSQALTAKVIEVVGHYNLIVEERRIKSNIETNKTSLKKFIVANIQRNTRKLQPIERLICNYRDKTPEEYKKETLTHISEYVERLEQEAILLQMAAAEYPKLKDSKVRQLNEYGIHPDTLALFLQYDRHFLIDLSGQLFECINAAKEFLKTFPFDKANPETLSNALRNFLIFQLNEIVRGGLALNDLITANADDSLFRGKLRDHLIDADIVIKQYVFDPLKPITKEHQSDFRLNNPKPGYAGDGYGQNKILYQSRLHAGHSKEDQERVLLGITAIEDAYQKSHDKPQQVLSAGWNNFSTRTKKQKIKRLAASILTFILHLPLSIINIVVATFSGRAPIARLMQKIEQYVQEKLGIEETFDHNFFRFAALLGGNNLYISTLIGKMFNNVLNEFTAFIIQSPELIYKKINQQLQNLKTDFATGFWAKNKPVPSSSVQNETIPDIKYEHYAHLEQLVESAKSLNKIKNNQLFAANIAYASPKTPLDPYAPQDIFSAVVTGFTGFINFFKDHIFEKNPYLGFVAMIAYACGAGAVLTPAALKVIFLKLGMTEAQASSIISLLVEIGKPLAKGQESQAIASGFTLAKAMGVSINTISQGFDSALFELLDAVRKEPLLYAVGVGIAYSFGHLVTDVINIPGLTNLLKDDIGTMPALCKILIGAKLGLISLETALPEDEHHKSILATFVSDVVKNMMIFIRMMLSVVSLSKRPWIDFNHQLIKGAAIFAHAANKLAVNFSQVLFQLPKMLLEVSTTSYINCVKALNYIFTPLRKKESHEVPTASTLLRIKHGLLHIGYKIGHYVRKNVSRRLENFYGKSVKELDKLPLPNKNNYGNILQKLKVYEVEEYFCTDDIQVYRSSIQHNSRDNTHFVGSFYKELRGRKQPEQSAAISHETSSNLQLS